ncbi:MAG: hypothetical protein NT069_25925 [Planctomycetota bacterium]|nr:hypothetical protein [Planctomycetota bacterium]
MSDFLNDRSTAEKEINGAILSAIHSHGPITGENYPSASKRVIGTLKALRRRFLLEKLTEEAKQEATEAGLEQGRQESADEISNLREQLDACGKEIGRLGHELAMKKALHEGYADSWHKVCEQISPHHRSESDVLLEIARLKQCEEAAIANRRIADLEGCQNSDIDRLTREIDRLNAKVAYVEDNNALCKSSAWAAGELAKYHVRQRDEAIDLCRRMRDWIDPDGEFIPPTASRLVAEFDLKYGTATVSPDSSPAQAAGEAIQPPTPGESSPAPTPETDSHQEQSASEIVDTTPSEFSITNERIEEIADGESGQQSIIGDNVIRDFPNEVKSDYQILWSERRALALKVQDQTSVRKTQRNRLKKLDAETRELKRQIEVLNMQLAACSTASKQNTRDSVSKRLAKHSPYWSVAYSDVCEAVDREMMNRERAQSAEIELQKYRNAELQALGFSKTIDDLLTDLEAIRQACIAPHADRESIVGKVEKLNREHGELILATGQLDHDSAVAWTDHICKTLDNWRFELARAIGMSSSFPSGTIETFTAAIQKIRKDKSQVERTMELICDHLHRGAAVVFQDAAPDRNEVDHWEQVAESVVDQLVELNYRNVVAEREFGELKSKINRLEKENANLTRFARDESARNARLSGFLSGRKLIAIDLLRSVVETYDRSRTGLRLPEDFERPMAAMCRRIDDFVRDQNPPVPQDPRADRSPPANHLANATFQFSTFDAGWL